MCKRTSRVSDVRHLIEAQNAEISSANRVDITIEYPQLTISGDMLHDAEQCALVHHDPAEGDEWLSIDLTASGYVARPGECFVKDWSEHSGFATALASAGVIDILELVVVGPFGSRAYRVHITGI